MQKAEICKPPAAYEISIPVFELSKTASDHTTTVVRRYHYNYYHHIVQNTELRNTAQSP
jgi:hypothetical protein